MKPALFLHHQRGSSHLKYVVTKSIQQCLSTRADVDRSSKAIRCRFIDYFVKEHGHTFIRSSPVVPFCDATVPFVNAGMNQFKGVFLGRRLPPCQTAANSQKCIRVGGKHSDLDLVGNDGYHHTFFEMLGNWSFNDYFKMEACKMAWELLTNVFGISPSRLYVTYFSGDKNMGVEPDLETKYIWQSIGVPEDHILPFGAADNFWEMAVTGPCGPCTEIHIDHIAGRTNAGDKVNKGYADMTELWNLVFIQYNRTAENQLEKLNSQHVDTGMGFERLVALLQGKTSNYDTDLFQPLFCAIEKETGAVPYKGTFLRNGVESIDSAYRILADHSRMVTVALADGMFPDQNHKLRRVLRKAMLVSQQVFHVKKGLLKELTNYVAESLADTYPEIGNRLKQVQLIIDHEEDVLARLRSDATTEWQVLASRKPQLQSLNAVEMPGLVLGYEELQAVVPSLRAGPTGAKPALPTELAFKLYDTYGLDRDTIARLADAEGLTLNTEEFLNTLDDVKSQSRADSALQDGCEYQEAVQELQDSGVAHTYDGHKYDYERVAGTREYLFPVVESVVQGIVVGGKLVQHWDVGAGECCVVVDRTNFYHEAGGQVSDTGLILAQDCSKLVVTNVVNIQGYVLHSGILTGNDGGRISVGDPVRLEVSPVYRVGNMRNHTATHILNAAVRQRLSVTCQKSSRVCDSKLSLEFSVYGELLNSRDVEGIEEAINNVIRMSVPVKRRTMNASEMLMLDGVTLVPGEVYPEENIHLIEIESDKLTSRELCCGTHVKNTSDVCDFCIVSVAAVGAGVRSIQAVTGPCTSKVRQQGKEVELSVRNLSSIVSKTLQEECTPEQIETLNRQLCDMQQLLMRNDNKIPYLLRLRCLDVMHESLKQLKAVARTTLRDAMKEEMQTVLQLAQQHSENAVVHFLRCSSVMDSVPLQKATKMAAHMPVLLLAKSEGLVKARCCVPENFVSDEFNAELWMQSVLVELKVHGYVPRGQNPLHVYNMKGKKVPEGKFEDVIARALEIAKDFAKRKIDSGVVCIHDVAK